MYTLKHDAIVSAILDRKARDECLPNLTYQLSSDRKSITGIKVNSAVVDCGKTISVTLPSTVKDTTNAVATQWDKYSQELQVSPGAERSYTLSTPLAF